MDTTIALPKYEQWTGSPGWSEHLLDHDRPTEGCPGCAIRPMLTDIHDFWQSASGAERVQVYGLSDGYGEIGFVPGQGYDWSGIRDSSPAAVARMHAQVRLLAALR